PPSPAPNKRKSMRLISWGLMTSVLLMAGCSSENKTYVIKGKVTGKNLQLPAKENTQRITVTFIPLDDGNKPSGADREEAKVDFKTGAFEVLGPKGKGIKPGKYRIAVQQTDNSPEAMAKVGGVPPIAGVDLLGGRYGESNSPFIREIKGDETINLDLDNPTK